MRAAVRAAMWDEMHEQPRSMLLGEAITTKGGASQLALGFEQEFGPRRVIETPISENALVGGALGAALAGWRVFCEVYSADFLFCAGSEVINDIAKWRYQQQWTAPINLVLRMPMGSSGIAAGPEHTQNIEGLLHHVPGLRIVVPACPHDAYEGLRGAIGCADPVIFLEHRALYDRSDCAHREDPARPDRWTTGEVVRVGSDVTVVAWARMLGVALAAADTLDAEGIRLEVVNPISVKPLPLDIVAASLSKTGRLLVVQEAPITGGIAAELVAWASERGNGVSVARVGMPDVHFPFHPSLEEHVLPTPSKVTEAVRALVGA